MTHNVVILDVAKPDFRDIRKYVKAQFGEHTWQDVNLEFKKIHKAISENPHAGKQIDELAALGQTSFRFRLVRQTRVCYEIMDDSTVMIFMYIHTKMDFRTHLAKRMLER